MSLWRMRSFFVCPALAGLLLSGCGGDETARKEPAAQQATSRAATPPPSFDVDHVRTSLLPPKDVASDVKAQAPTFPGLTEAGVPSCSATTIRLTGKPKTLGRQLETSKRGYTGTHYIQQIAIYPDAAAATSALAAIRAKVKACPAKRHFPSKRLGEKRFSIQHTDTWEITEDTVAGWTHIRGFEKHVEPPRTSRFNVFYDVYDYAARGNVVVASLYWERVKPTARGATIADKATKVLTKQLQEIG